MNNQIFQNKMALFFFLSEQVKKSNVTYIAYVGL